MKYDFSHGSSPVFSRKGQLELPFNWIYVLIAGAVILLFFVGVVVKQKESVTQQLGTEVTQIVESIFSAAASSESTKIVLDTAGFADEELYFTCQNGTSEYGITGKGAPATDFVVPIFSPNKITSGKLFLWSLPYALPYKTANFLYVTAPTVQYVLVGNDVHAQEFLKESKSSQDAKFAISVVQVNDLNSYSPAKGMQALRFVDFTGSSVPGGSPLPAALQSWGDEQVSAVVLSGGRAEFLLKKGNVWKSEGFSPLFSLGGELDTVYYAAIFSGKKEMFECNMRKAFQRLKHVAKVYQNKGLALIESSAAQSEPCPVAFSNLAQLLVLQQTQTGVCAEFYPEGCAEVVQAAAKLKAQNEVISHAGCPALY